MTQSEYCLYVVDISSLGLQLLFTRTTAAAYWLAPNDLHTRLDRQCLFSLQCRHGKLGSTSGVHLSYCKQCIANVTIDVVFSKVIN